MSGCRRMVPVEEHGASSSTASKRSSGRHATASDSTVSASSPSRVRFSASSASRVFDESTATPEPPAAGGEHAAGKALGPQLGLAFYGEIERRLDQMRLGDGPCPRLAPIGDP